MKGGEVSSPSPHLDEISLEGDLPTSSPLACEKTIPGNESPLRGMKDGWYGEKLMDPFPALSSNLTSNFPDWKGSLCSCLPTSWIRFMTFSALLVCMAVNTALRAIIGSGFKAIQEEFQLSSTQLGMIPFLRNLTAALVLPFGSVLCDMFSRRLILVYSFIYLGGLTIVLGLVESFLSFLMIRTVSGLAFDLIIPIIVSYIGDYFRRDKRGLAFGAQGISAGVGGIVGIISMGTFSSTIIAGYAGWRVICVLWGMVCVVTAIGAIFFVFEPVRGQTELEEPSEKEEQTEIKTQENESFLIFEWEALRHIFFTDQLVQDEEGNQKEESNLNYAWFLLVWTQLFSQLPWLGFGFLILWYQYNGMSAFEASLSYSIAGVGFMVGSFVGGIISDKLSRLQSKWGRDFGRIILAQVSLILLIPVVFVLIKIIGKTGSVVGMFAMSSVMGFLASFSEQACDMPLLTEIVHPNLRSSSVGFVTSIAGVLSSIGSVVMGYIAEGFGYESKGVAIQDLAEEERVRNATALGNAFLAVGCFAWGLQCLAYCFLYVAYPQRRNFVHSILKMEEKEKNGEEREAICEMDEFASGPERNLN